MNEPKEQEGLIARCCRRATSLFPALALSGFFVAGILFWGGFNWAMEASNEESFCISCHEMEQFPYAEYKTSVHYSNRTGVRASCPDCHVPRTWVHKVMRKIGATNELFHWAIGSIDTKEKFEAKREVLAHKVWDSMKATDSRECRNCHESASMAAASQTPKAATLHELGREWSMTCIECHKGIVHTLPSDNSHDKFMDKLHQRIEDAKVKCSRCHEKMRSAPAGDGWD